MIILEDGLTYNGRCVWGMSVGYIIDINSRTYRIRWLDRSETEQLRPDLEDEDEIMLEAAE